MAKTACVILNYNDSENVIKLFNKIKDYKCLDEIIIVDNHSTDNSYERLKEIDNDKVRVVLTDHNGGYGYGNNEGMKIAFNTLNCDYSLIANPDVEFSEELVLKFVGLIEADKQVGIVSAIQKDIKGKEVLESAWKLPKKMQYVFSIGKLTSRLCESIYYKRDELYSEKEKVVGCIAGSLLCISKNAFNLTGGYDENIFLYCEETVLGYKLASVGLKSILLTDFSYSHLHGVTIGKAFKHRSKRQKLLNTSHHYVVGKYLKANVFERALDKLICGIRLLETYVVDMVRKH